MKKGITINIYPTPAITAETMIFSASYATTTFAAGSQRFTALQGNQGNSNVNDSSFPGNAIPGFGTVMPVSGTFSKLRVIGSLPAGVDLRIFGFVTEGSLGLLQCTVTNADSDTWGNGIGHNNSNSIHVSAGDLCAFLIDGNQDSNTWKGTISVQFIPD